MFSTEPLGAGHLTIPAHTDFHRTASAIELGAPLYVPATMCSLRDISQRIKYPNLKSVIFCTEDSIRHTELYGALCNLESMLGTAMCHTELRRFIRVRTPEVLRQCLEMPGIQHIEGFVLPKITPAILPRYLELLLPQAGHTLMLTLETPEVFQPSLMEELRSQILCVDLAERIIALRIGGNDLMNLLGIRRRRGDTLYNTPLQNTIAQLLTIFKPVGFPMSAPVFEFLGENDALAQEVINDVTYGLLPKAAIHPGQVARIERHYRVVRDDFEAARAILDITQPAVFRSHGFMCEPATHTRWAKSIIDRARVFGIM